MPPKGFSCKQCGNCCLNLGAYQACATDEDIALWEESGRDDILEWVDEVGPGIYDIWISPRTGDDVSRCPWLRKLPRQEKYICRIQDMKPGLCRNYPLSKDHAEKTGCMGFG
jgi:Fe-S-cluster containining protein